MDEDWPPRYRKDDWNNVSGWGLLATFLLFGGAGILFDYGFVYFTIIAWAVGWYCGHYDKTARRKSTGDGR